jgi:hypothetical protein
VTGNDIIEAVVSGGEDQVRRLFAEMAWCRTRAAAGIGADEPPFSLYDAGVTPQMRGEQVRQLRWLRRVLDAELRATRWQAAR